MSIPHEERLRIGQLLGNLMRLFRSELAEHGAILEGVAGIRPAHLQVFGTIKADGTRLTDLAAWSNMSLSSMAELVDDLERLGYLERRPDPDDRRAKLVSLTGTGWQAIRQGRHVIESIESDWASRLGEERFESLCQSLQALINALDPRVSQTYVAPPGRASDPEAETGRIGMADRPPAAGRGRGRSRTSHRDTRIATIATDDLRRAKARICR